MHKVFLIGSPRSGTTLLQSILTEQAGLYTLKETHFFRHLHRWRPVRLLDRVRLDPARTARAFAFIAENNRLEGQHDLAGITRLDAAVRAFDDLLTTEASIKGARGWLEKSPEHMFFMDEIRAHIDGAKFVHILRDGPDVVASLYDAYRKYPEHWGWLGSLDAMIRLYNRYARATRANRGRSDSFVVRYNDLVEKNAATLDRLAAFLDLPANTFSLDEISSYRQDIVRPEEAWKVRAEKTVVDTRGQKFKQLFEPAEQKRIQRSLAPIADIASG